MLQEKGSPFYPQCVPVNEFKVSFLAHLFSYQQWFEQNLVRVLLSARDALHFHSTKLQYLIVKCVGI